MKLWIWFSLAAFSFAAPTAAESTLVISTTAMPYRSQQGTVTIEGTSSLHDWSMSGRDIRGVVRISAPFNAKAPWSELKALLEDDKVVADIDIPVKSLKSGTEAMDENAYEALKAKDHPMISYQMEGAKLGQSPDGSMVINTVGRLMIGGVARPVALHPKVTRRDDGTLEITGSLDVKMSTFDLEAPSFMFGVISTGDAIKIHYQWAISPSKT